MTKKRLAAHKKPEPQTEATRFLEHMSETLDRFFEGDTKDAEQGFTITFAGKTITLYLAPETYEAIEETMKTYHELLKEDF